jgi:hypothetical protein
MILAAMLAIAAAMLVVSPWTGAGLYPDHLANVATGLAMGLFAVTALTATSRGHPLLLFTCVLLLILAQVAGMRGARAEEAAMLAEGGEGMS